MKNLICLISVFCCSLSLIAQDTVKTLPSSLTYAEIERIFAKFNKPHKTVKEEVESKISKILTLNMNTKLLKDSVAFYAFTILVEGNKTKKIFKITKIKSGDSLYYALFPKTVALLKYIDFGVFLKKGGFSQIIIPIAVVVTAHDKMPKDSTLDIWSIPKRLNSLFAVEFKSRYQPVFLNPLCIMVSKEIYN